MYPHTCNIREQVLKDARNRLVRWDNLAPQFREDIEVLSAMLHEYGNQFTQLSRKMRDNKELTLAAISNFAQVLENASPRLRDDEDCVNLAIESQGNNIQYASHRLRRNFDTALYAVIHNSHAYRFISKKLKKEPVIIEETLYGQGMSLAYMDFSIRSDEKWFSKAMDTNSAAFRFGAGEFIFQEKYILAALKYNGEYLSMMPDHIKADKKMVMLAVTSGEAIQYSPFTDDEDVALCALKHTGAAFEHLSTRLQGDNHIFFQACKKICKDVASSPLKFASIHIKSSPSILIKALDNNLPVFALKHADPNVLNDMDLLIKAAEKNSRSLREIIAPALLEMAGNNDLYIFLKHLKLRDSFDDILKKKSDMGHKVKI